MEKLQAYFLAHPMAYLVPAMQYPASVFDNIKCQKAKIRELLFLLSQTKLHQNDAKTPRPKHRFAM